MAPSDLFINLGLSQKRKLTDVPFLILFAICVFMLMLIGMIYAIGSSDINIMHRDTNGYVSKEINDKLGFMAIVCCIGLGLSVIALFCFRYFVNVFVWTVMIVTVLLMCALIGYFWYWGFQHFQQDWLIGVIILTLLLLTIAVYILVLRKKIKLIIEFYEEAIKIVFAMPLLFLVSLLTFISILVIAALWRYMIVLLNNSAGGGFFGQDVGTIFLKAFVLIMMSWMFRFVIVCQQMVVSGAVATYYFTRDKTALVSPIYSSFYNLMRYHLGSVAFGSVIVVTFRPLKYWLKYLIFKGLIVTAIRGRPFSQSGVRAVNLLDSNLLSAIAMSSVGSFVHCMLDLLVVGITGIIGFLMMNSIWPVVFGAVFAFFCAHCIFVVFDIAVDTVFICYCEDFCLNYGKYKPFYATVELHRKVKKVQDFTKSVEEKRCVF